MKRGQSAKAFARKIVRSRSHLRALRLPNQARRLLSHTGLAGHRDTRYTVTYRGNHLPHLEAKTRFQLLRKGGTHD